MIRAHRLNATAQDDSSPIVGWNIAPNIAYSVTLVPEQLQCGVVLYTETGGYVGSGLVTHGIAQPCVLTPSSSPIDMVDAALGWHLLLTTNSSMLTRVMRISPAVDLPDEIHPVYADDDLAIVRATAGIDEAAHYIDDVDVSCPLGLGAWLGDVVSVPGDGVAVVGQVESTTWTAMPNETNEKAVIHAERTSLNVKCSKYIGNLSIFVNMGCPIFYRSRKFWFSGSIHQLQGFPPHQ